MQSGAGARGRVKGLVRSAKGAMRTAYGRYSVARHGFWFVDVPRTSSTSIRSELARQFGRAYGKNNVIEKHYALPQCFPDHLTAREMRAVLGAGLWNRLFTFAMVRNPWDRTYSMYNYRRKVRSIPPEWSFREYVVALGRSTPTSEHFAHHAFRYGSSEYVTSEDGELIVDYVGRYEKRVDDLQFIASRLDARGLGQVVLQKASPPGEHYSQHYDVETESIVGDLYRKDVELFGYRFEAPPGSAGTDDD